MEQDNPHKAWQSAELEVGKTVKLGANGVVNFKITTESGTVLEGVIPANEYLSITNGGDISSVDVNIYDQSSGPESID